jgi:hypothetical protein
MKQIQAGLGRGGQPGRVFPDSGSLRGRYCLRVPRQQQRRPHTMTAIVLGESPRSGVWNLPAALLSGPDGRYIYSLSGVYNANEFLRSRRTRLTEDVPRAQAMTSVEFTQRLGYELGTGDVHFTCRGRSHVRRPRSELSSRIAASAVPDAKVLVLVPNRATVVCTPVQGPLTFGRRLPPCVEAPAVKPGGGCNLRSR